MDSVSNRKFVRICSCMWEYLHLTIPPRIKLLRIAAITMKLPRSSLFSYQIIWMTGFLCFCFFFFSLLPILLFLKSAGAHILYEILPPYAFRVFEILSRLLAMGQGKRIFELNLCGSIF